MILISMLAIIVCLIQLFYDQIIAQQINCIIISSWIHLIFITYDYMFEFFKYTLQLICVIQRIFVNIHHCIVVVLFCILFDDSIANQKNSTNPNKEINNGVQKKDNINDSNNEKFFALLKACDIIIKGIIRLLKTVTEYQTSNILISHCNNAQVR